MEAVGRLVGGVAHDFNNLLTGIMLYCDLLLGELPDDSRSRRHVQEMRMAGEHGAAMVQQLLAAARPPAGESQAFVLNHAITAIEDLLIRMVGENIVLSTALAADLGQVKMDPEQIQQILLNLVLNARDGRPDGGRITVSTRNGTDSIPISGESESQAVQWVTGYGTVQSAVQAMKNGAYDYVTKPFSMEELRLLLERVSGHLRLKTENRTLREKIKSKLGFDSSHPVLILGESGTGKKMVARSIHFSRPFRDKPFIPVDCGSLVPTLIESELFG